MKESRELALVAARAASSKQGEAIVVLDVRELIAITDYFVITSANSERQLRTVSEEIERSLRAEGVKPVREEGSVESGWLLLDFVDFVVHVFRDDQREYYRLENLWRDAPVVSWEGERPAEASG